MSKKENIIKKDINNFSYESMMIYNQAVIMDRALPNVFDGLKPIQRRLLFGSHRGRYNSSGRFIKSVKIVGEILATLSPHGDSSTYDAMVNIIRDFTNNQPLMEGHGSFSSILGDQAASYRYTDARLNKFSENYLLDGVDNNTVDMVPSFDGEILEPVVLPAKLPMILVNGITGIGAGGFASSIPPHSIESIINSTVALLKNDKTTTSDLIHKYNLKPSFPFGGHVDISEIDKIYTTGTGTFTTRANIITDIESDKKFDLVIIDELPFNITLQDITDQIKSIHNNDKLKEQDKFIGLKNLEDHSFRGNVKLVLYYTKGTNLQLAIKQLYDKTNLQSFISFNPNMLKDENTLVEYTDISDILKDWIEFRKKTVKRDKMNKVRNLERRIHILEAIILVFRNKKNTEKFIEIIRDSKDRKEVYDTLQSEFRLNKVQSEYLTNLKIYNINQFESNKYEEELADKKQEVEKETKYLRDEKELVKFIIDELNSIKKSKYLTKAKHDTKYYTEDKLADIDSLENAMPRIKHLLVLTKNGLLKKVEDTQKSQGRNGKGYSLGRIRDDDLVSNVMSASSHDNILLATDKGYLFIYKVYEMPDSTKINNLGTNIRSFVKGQNIVGSFILTDDELKGDKLLTVSTNDGYIKATDLNEFTNGNRNGLLMVKLKDENSFVKSLGIIDKNEYEKANIIITKDDGTYVMYKLSDIPVLNRNTRGVSAYNNRDEVNLVGSHITYNEKYIVLVGKDAKGKIVDIDTLSTTNRPSSGQIIMGEKNLAYSELVLENEVKDEKSELLIASNKKTITIPLSSLKEYKRPAKGISLKSLESDESILNCSLII